MNTTLYLISNALHIFAMYIFISALLGKSCLPRKLEAVTYAGYYICNVFVYLFLDNMILNLLSNFVPLFLIILQYKKSIINNIFIPILIVAVGMFLDLMCSCIAPAAALVRSNTIQSIALMGIAFLFRFFYKKDEKILVNSLYVIVLIMVSIGTIVIGIFEGPEFNTRSFIIALILIMINFFNFYLYKSYIRNMKMRLEYNAVQTSNQAYKNQLEILNESEKRLRFIKHDIKNHLYKIKNNITSEKYDNAILYIDEMTKNIDPEQEFVKTGNDDIDCIMNYKLAVAKDMGVEFFIKINLPEELNVNSFDLTVILGNLLDNALCALSTAENKILKIDINYSVGMIVIQIKNTVGKKVERENEHEHEHGYGLISVRSSLEKYRGTLHNEVIDNYYAAKAIFYNIVGN